MQATATRMPSWFHLSFVPSVLLLLCPPAVFIFWYVAAELGGSFQAFWVLSAKQGLFSTLSSIWGPVFFGSPLAWKIILIFATSQALLMRIVPGKPFLGPITPKGNVPVYKANGLPCFLITVIGFAFCSFVLKLFPATLIYDEFGPLLGALNCLSLCFCFLLYLKGIYRPSSSDHGTTGNFLFDYYWGTELYPRVLGWDIKQFTNCRFGMMSWSLILFSYAAKQYVLYGFISDSMLVSVGLQLIYIAKFFVWETGYFRSLDIMHDRAGFMICWGCLVWVPCIYTSPALYLVKHPNQLGWVTSSLLFLCGVLAIGINYLADRQRQQVRANPEGTLVWGKAPKLIPAVYTTAQGEVKKTILLASGWWGVSRHFHYVPELLGALCWSLPALFTHFAPYFYFFFLTILLLDRAFRHDRRCQDKYGEAWKQYCEKVPYKIIPGVF